MSWRGSTCGAFIAGASRLLVAQPSLARRHRLITYHRRGYAGSSRVADCRALLRHVAVERARVLGYSFGGCVALQRALSALEAAHSLVVITHK